MNAGQSGLLALVQWLSPAFPLGSFAYSHGLEAAVAAGEVRTARDLALWVGDVLDHGSGRIDAALLAAALRTDADHDGLAALARARAATRERLEETEAQGAAFTATVNALTGTAHPPAPLPVAVGRAAQALGLADADVIALYLQAFATQLVLAGVRFIPLGQTEGQAAIAGLAPAIARIAAESPGADPRTLGSAAFGADMAAAEHETMDVRIFRS